MKLRQIHWAIGSSLLLLLATGCERAEKHAEQQYVPEYAEDTLILSAEEKARLAELFKDDLALLGKVKGYSDANATRLKEHNKWARAHNIQALKAGNVPQFLIDRAYPKTIQETLPDPR